ncbi:MAG: ATP-binding protein [Elusimicrobia bacterium]|nr:ATP-binding protein [Elusimicrobiota bacterium]
MIPRQAYRRRLSDLLKTFPLVSILGPRQCGKTTFIRGALPAWRYLDLERPSDAAVLAEDPEHGLGMLDSSFILDEAQRVPELFPVLRSHVDAARTRKGRAVLLGSASPALVRNLSESLAGRVGFLEMTPLLRWELPRAEPSLGKLWLTGGFPDAYLARSTTARRDWFDAYTRTFLEQDLPSLGIEVSSAQMRKLWIMVAHAHGGLWNASQLAASLGVSYHTVNRYMDILEQTFLVRKLTPYFANVGKRMTKSPKVFIRDSGLLHYLLGIHDREDLETNPARGASWEGFVIEQMSGLFALFAPGSESYHWRTAAGAEVDLLIRHRGRLIPFEIKLHSAPSLDGARGLLNCMQDLRLRRGYILYPGSKEYSLAHGVTVLPAERQLADPNAFLDRLASD